MTKEVEMKKQAKKYLRNWVFLSKFKTEQEILAISYTIFPVKLVWDDFVQVFNKIPINPKSRIAGLVRRNLVQLV